MDVKVRFRFNKLTGAVEVFDVDQQQTLPEREHHGAHDRLAADIGALLARFPQISELAPVRPSAVVKHEPGVDEGDEDTAIEGPVRQKATKS